MLRFIAKFLFILTILVVLSTAALQWKVKKNIEDFAFSMEPFFSFDYESSSISLIGEVNIHSISIFSENIGSKVHIGQIKISLGSLYQLAFFDLIDLPLPSHAYISFQDILIPFSDKIVENLSQKTPPSSWDILQTVYCGNTEKFDLRELESMGYSYLLFNSHHAYSHNEGDDVSSVHGSLNAEDLVSIDYKVNLDDVTTWIDYLNKVRLGFDEDLITSLGLSFMDINIKDRGFNLRKAGYCAKKEMISLAAYYSGHADKVEGLLSQVEIQMTPSFKQHYLQSVKPDSQLNVILEPKAGFKLNAAKNYSYQQLADLLRLKLKVNDTLIENYVENGTTEKFSKIAGFRREVKVQVQEQNQGSSDYHYETIKIIKAFQPILLSAAGQYIDERVRLVRQGGKSFEGKLIKISENKLWLEIEVDSGEVLLPIDLKQIESFDVYLEVKSEATP